MGSSSYKQYSEKNNIYYAYRDNSLECEFYYSVFLSLFYLVTVQKT